MPQELERELGVTYIGPRSFVLCFAAVCAVFAAIVFGASRFAESIESPLSVAAPVPSSRSSAASVSVPNAARPRGAPLGAARPPSITAVTNRAAVSTSAVAAPHGSAAPARPPARPAFARRPAAAHRGPNPVAARSDASGVRALGRAQSPPMAGAKGVLPSAAAVAPHRATSRAAHARRDVPAPERRAAGVHHVDAESPSRALLVPIAASTSLNARGSLEPRSGTLFVGSQAARDASAAAPPR
jgi:hypothetical protein